MTRREFACGLAVLCIILMGVDGPAWVDAGEWAPYETEGRVLGIVPEQGLIVIDHEPIRAPGYLMGSMEMPFSVQDRSQLNGLKIGDRVRFRVSEEKKSRIVEIMKLP